jgi:hypothetical protein
LVCQIILADYSRLFAVSEDGMAIKRCENHANQQHCWHFGLTFNSTYLYIYLCVFCNLSFKYCSTASCSTTAVWNQTCLGLWPDFYMHEARLVSFGI